MAEHPLDIARRINDAAGGTAWETDVAAHLSSGGYFLASGSHVLLWRPVWRAWPEARLLNPWEADPEGDAWYVWMAVGDVHLFADLVPIYPVKDWVAFHRRGSPKWYRTAQLTRRIHGQKIEQRRGSQGAEKGERSGSEELRAANEADAEAAEKRGEYPHACIRGTPAGPDAVER